MGGAGSSGSGGSSGATGGCAEGTTVLSEKGDYKFSSTLTFPPIKVKPTADLTLDWSAVSKDFIGHDLKNATDINSVLIILWTLPLPDLQTKLNADSLSANDTATFPLSLETDGKAMSAPLTDLTLSGTKLTPMDRDPYFDATKYPPDKNTYTFIAATGTVTGQGTRMIQSFQLDPTSTNTTVKMTNDSTKLDYSVDLHSLESTPIPSGSSKIKLDWKDIKTNALATPFVARSVTKALVANYTESPAELEKKFLDLELIAKSAYRTDISSGTELNFADLKDDAGKPFSGITKDGTWIAAAFCGKCRNPAPWYLTILKPCN